MSNILIQKPSIQGEIKNRAFYRTLDTEATLPLLLIGHADADRMFEPYKVYDMQDAVRFLGGDESSPLMQALLESFNSGCTNIWLYPAAPMSEYISNVSDRNTDQVEFGNINYYEKYQERLNEAYDVLKLYNEFDVVVPLEASFVDASSVDFITGLDQLCYDYYNDFGRSTLAVLGTRAEAYSDATIAEAVSEAEGASTQLGQNLILVYGEGLIANRQATQSYVYSYAGPVASQIVTVTPNRSIAGVNFTSVSNSVGPDFTEAQIDTLVNAKVNPVVRTQRGKRGQSYQTQLYTDNTLAPDNSSYWSLTNIRLVSYISNAVSEIALNYVGTTNLSAFESALRNFIAAIFNADMVRDIDFKITYTTYSSEKASIDIAVVPYGALKTIYFTVETGPGQ